MSLGWRAAGRPDLAVKSGNLLLLLSSVFFYAWGEPRLVVVMLFTIGVDWVAGLVIAGASWRGEGEVPLLDPSSPRSRRQRLALGLSLASNLGVLGFFKYFNFAVDNLDAVAGALGLDWFAWKGAFRVALPLGISFYTFQSMSYTIDVYRGEARANRSPLDFACFATLFPQLVAGPIVRYVDIAEELEGRALSSARFAAGVDRFVAGLAKKVLLANTLAAPADDIFALPAGQLTPALALLAVACYTLQIYFDFSGYSDMAIGMGRMLGFVIPENFAHPYAAQSVQEFWRRWHMTLSRWIRDYLFTPLAFRFRDRPRVLPWCVLLAMAACGLWHGASWTFLFWGLWHGLFQVLESGAFGRLLRAAPRVLRHAYLMVVVMLGWVLFRAETFAQALSFLKALAGAPAAVPGAELSHYLRSDVAWALAAGAVLATPAVPWLRARGKALRQALPAFAPLRPLAYAGELVVLGLLFLGSAMSLASGTHNPFIYFRF